MTKYELGNKNATVRLIQMVFDDDEEKLEKEIEAIRHAVNMDFEIIVVKVDDWNRDLSPWKAEAVFGSEGFGGGAEETLAFILKHCVVIGKIHYIGGYSLAGLFALWAACRTDAFAGVAAASPSVWFPGFMEYLTDKEIKASKVYMSLGEKEEKTRNKVMAKVGDHIRRIHECLVQKGIYCTLEWNPGNHFKDPDERTARAFAWLLQSGSR